MDIDSPLPHPLAESSTVNPNNEMPPSPPVVLSALRNSITEDDNAMSGSASHTPNAEASGSRSRERRGRVSTPASASTPSKSLRSAVKVEGDSGSASRASTPASASGSGRASRRKGPSLIRASGGSPTRSNGLSLDPSSFINGTAPAGALSIFAPPLSADLPEALQGVISPPRPTASSSALPENSLNGNGHSANGNGNGSGGRELRVRLTIPSTASSTNGNGNGEATGDSLIKEADEGLATVTGSASNRLRPTRGKDLTQRTGVSASGKGVRVGGGARVGASGPPTTVTRQKGAPGGDTNEGHCACCRGDGMFLCCDGCPRSFHFMCLEPPLRVNELPKEDLWYCRRCRFERKRTKLASPTLEELEEKPIPTVFKQLTREMESKNPEQFRLPDGIRNYFTGVTSNAVTGKYLDPEARLKIDRLGYQEQRDQYRLRDAKNRPVHCYACNGTALPSKSVTTDPGSTWRQIISCDYCSLAWHFDCLDPPMAALPSKDRKWMCPNHVDQVHKRRTVRDKLEMIDVTSGGIANNGNITIVPDEPVRPLLEYEDLFINRKKFRVPEKVIKLDFWAKLGYGRKRKRSESETSDLTSLNGSDESSSVPSQPPGRPFHRTANREDIEAANLILSWWNNGPLLDHISAPPLHTDPVLPNPSTTNTTESLGISSASGPSGTASLAGADEVPPNLATAANSPASTAGAEPRKITLKLKRGTGAPGGETGPPAAGL